MPSLHLVLALVGFELKRRLRLLSSYVYAGVLFAAGALIMMSAGGVFRGVAVSAGNERVMANAPTAIFGTTLLVSLFGLFTVAAVFGQAASQDFSHKTWMLIFSSNVRKAPYLLGRFLGAYLFSAGLFVTIVAGQFFGSGVVAVLHPEFLGPTSFVAYTWPLIIGVWPMLFFAGAAFFTLAALSRRMAPVYVGVVVMVLGYLLTTTLLQDVEHQTLAGLLDPFGFQAFGLVTRYWTPLQQNHSLLPLWSLFGANRLLWGGVALVLLGLCVARFRTTVEEYGKAAREGKGEPGPAEATAPSSSSAVLAEPAPSALAWARASLSLARLGFKEIVRSPVYWSFAVAGLAFVVLVLMMSKQILGTPTLPVTWKVLESAVGGFRLFTLITITFYAGELVWRERDRAVDGIVDATPSPSWTAYFGKLLALCLVALSLEGLVALAALTAQLAQGYFKIDGGLYLKQLLLLDYPHVLLICVLAFVVQVIVNHKYLGHAVMVGYFVSRAALLGLGVEEPLLRYASEPSLRYSDMNGFGQSLGSVLWYRAYGWGGAVLLLGLAYWLYQRGRESGLRLRWRAGAGRLGRRWRLTLVAAGLLMMGSGSVIYYNTHLLNHYLTEKISQREQAEYEKRYKAWQQRPQPRITAAEFNADLYPDERRMHAFGSYTLTNKSEVVISELFLNFDESLQIKTLRVGESSKIKEQDRRLGVTILSLDHPLEPGESQPLVYDLEMSVRGFSHGGDSTAVVANGSFVNNMVLPLVGYQPAAELVEDSDRKDYNLTPKERMAPRDDPEELKHNYIRRDSDFIHYKATVSTRDDQIALAPGTLVKDWQRAGRHYFQYQIDQPILNFFSVLSARYAVQRDHWKDVKLEIYYQPGHETNLLRMMRGMKDALAYCSKNFGPYQFKQLRIVEFPRYATFAQSFPGTIPYSEGIGFIAKVRDDDPDDVDYPYYVTAHEVAHQWWAHQVVGANVRGATMTSETMAQYSALMVMKQRYGADRMRRFLKFELDHYLMGRAMERKKELPLALNENQQYLHYNKGSVAMYALQDAIGEDTVNRAMKKYVAKVRFQGPPYTTSAELESFLSAEMRPDQQYLLKDLFETITFYDNRSIKASVTPSPAGGFDLSLEVFARKFRSDEAGKQTELELQGPIDIGGLDSEGAGLCVEKQRVNAGSSKLKFHCPTRPAKVGIDPLNKLIDKDSGDNVVVPSLETPST